MEPTETSLPPIDAASTALAQLNVTLTAQAPTETPTPPPPRTGEICALVFEDKNENGEYEEAETPLDGVVIMLEHDQVGIETKLRVAERDPFCFSDLPPGDYRITVDAPTGYSGTTVVPETINLGAGERVVLAWGFVEAPISEDAPVMVRDIAATGVLPVESSDATFYLLLDDGLARTDDGGKSWTQRTERVPASHVVPSPSDPDRLYAGEGQDCFRDGHDAPLYLSKDGGQSWSELPSGLNLRPAAAHPADPETAWAIGCAGVYRTEDGGMSWQLQEAKEWGLYSPDEIIVVSTNPEVLYASGNSEGGSGALFRSEDAGAQWETVTDEFSLWISALLVSPGDSDQIWVATPHGIWRSSDGGAEWQLSADGLETVTVGDDYEFEGRGLDALARASSGVLFLGAKQGLYQSLDGGASWTAISQAPWGVEPVYGVAVFEDRNQVELWVSAESGVYLFKP